MNTNKIIWCDGGIDEDDDCDKEATWACPCGCEIAVCDKHKEDVLELRNVDMIRL